MGKTKTQKTLEEVQELQPLPHVDLNRLHKEVSLAIFQSGIELRNQGRARQDRIYPWRYLVTGERHSTGITAYRVDLSDVSCGCKWYKITGSPCKHVVAALLDYIAKQE